VDVPVAHHAEDVRRLARESTRRPGLAALDACVSVCRACPRLVAWREQVATEKRRSFADEVTVAVGFYPAVPWEKMSPSWGNYAGKAAMIHASEEDGTSQAEGVQVAVKGIEAAGGDVEVFDYPGSKHAFFNDQRPEVHDAEHSARAWGRTIELLKRRL